MNWIFLLIGFFIGLFTFLIMLGVYHAARIYGIFRVDRRNLDKFRFRLEFTKDPTSINDNTKYILFKIEDAELKSIEEE